MSNYHQHLLLFFVIATMENLPSKVILAVVSIIIVGHYSISSIQVPAPTNMTHQSHFTVYFQVINNFQVFLLLLLFLTIIDFLQSTLEFVYPILLSSMMGSDLKVKVTIVIVLPFTNSTVTTPHMILITTHWLLIKMESNTIRVLRYI